MKKVRLILILELKMPVITMEVGKLSKEQKKDLIKGFTEVASEITGIDKKFIISYS